MRRSRLVGVRRQLGDAIVRIAGAEPAHRFSFHIYTALKNESKPPLFYTSPPQVLRTGCEPEVTGIKRPSSSSAIVARFLTRSPVRKQTTAARRRGSRVSRTAKRTRISTRASANIEVCDVRQRKHRVLYHFWRNFGLKRVLQYTFIVEC